MEIDHASFHERILADLDDDGPRAVYADRLQEVGDPRGELIALSLIQARDGATARQLRRIQTLVRENRPAWLGDLPKLCKELRFERGFLDKVTFKSNIESSSPEVVAAALDHPELRFVRQIAYWSTVHRTIHLAPAFRSVRDIFFPIGDEETALAIARDRHPRSWQSLRAGDVLVRGHVFAAVADSPSLRRVTRLSVRVWAHDLPVLVELARHFGWPTPDGVETLRLELGAGFERGAARYLQLQASGVAELAREVTWSTPYGERGRIEAAG